MRKTERLFGFGLLLAGVGLPFLVEKLSGSTTAAIWTCVICLLGAIVLIFLSFQQDQDGPELEDGRLFRGGAIPESGPGTGTSQQSEELKPARLEIAWHPGEKPYLHEYRMPNDPSQALHTHFRVVVTNLSKSEQARDVEVILEDLSPRTLDCVPCHLRPMNNILPGDTPIETFDLNPKGNRPIDVMMWRPDSSRFQIWHTVLRQPTDVPAQPYTMKITASAANATPMSKTFDIFRDGAAWNMRMVEEAPVPLTGIPRQDKEVLIGDTSDDRPFGEPQPWPRPKLTVYGYQYPDLELDANQVWQCEGSRKGLAFNVRNDMYDDGTGTDAEGVRVQVIFHHSNGVPGPSFSTVPWIGERYGITTIPAGTQKQFLLGIKMGAGGQGHGWMGYATSRLSSDDDEKSNVLRSDYLADDGTMTIKIIALVGIGEPRVVHESYHEWKIDFSTNHPFFSQIPTPH